MPRPSLARAAAAGFTLAATAATLLLAAPAASAADFPAPTMSKATVVSGESITFSGVGCDDGSGGPFMAILESNDPGIRGAAAVHADHTWSITTAITPNGGPGTYTVNASCDAYDGAMTYAPVTITVLAAGATAPAPVAAPGCTDCAKLSSGKVDAGQKITLTYGGFQPGELVTIVMRSTPVTLGTFTADANGVVTVAFTVPAGAPAGSHTLTFTGPLTGDRVLGFTLASSSSLAYTGADVTVPLTAGIALVLAGGGLVFVGRRRAAGTARS